MDCESIPSCAEMGYTQDSCSGGKGVRCPFDENKFYCAGVKQLPDAPEPVVTPEDWTAECADKIAYCTAYNTECQCTACESGYLLSDGACVPECDKSADTCAAENKIFKEDTCTCEACPTNYQFNSETKACEQIACDTTKVEHCTTYDSEYEPCDCQTCETNYLLVDGVCKKMCTIVENCKTYDSEYDPCKCTACEDGLTLVNGVCVPACYGSDKCKDSSGNCITCYSSCSAYNSSYKDSEPSGYTCSSTSVIIGAGNGATATSKNCYYDCTKDCSGANQCLYNTNCVECYPSCSDFSSTYSYEEQPSGAICTPAYTKIGSGYGAEAVSKPCYGYCATCEIACSIYAGLANTKAAVDQTGSKALAAYAASQFYVDSKTGFFGQGKWYLPAIGEWMEFYGTDMEQAAEGNHPGSGNGGVIGDNMALINAALNTLAGNGVEAEAIGVGNTQYDYNRYWSSTEMSEGSAYFLEGNTGGKGGIAKNNSYSVRFALILKNAFTGSGTAPKIGDVMYSDRSYGSASNYDSSKTSVGIIASISENGRDVKIINLKNLTFKSVSTPGNFDPENPYGSDRKVTHWSDSLNKNITGIYDLEAGIVGNVFKLLALGNCSCSKYPCNLDTATCATEGKTFNSETCACEACPNENYTVENNKCICSLNAAKCAENKQIFDSATCTCEDCPNNQTFDEDGNFCRTCEGKQKEGTCAVGENFIEWSKYEDGTACGDCVNCLDESTQNNPCVKEGIYKYTCQGGGRYPIGESDCECGSVPYYTKCGVEETCFEESYINKQENGGVCNGAYVEGGSAFKYGGDYPVRYKCTRNTDAKKVYYGASCTVEKDCDGNPGLAYGLDTCYSSVGIGDPVICGGRKYYQSCDSCISDEEYQDNGGICKGSYVEDGAAFKYGGIYSVRYKCTSNGEKVYYGAACNVEKDCDGKSGPAAGLINCFSDPGIGDPVVCGGREFYETCDPCKVDTYLTIEENGGICRNSHEEGAAAFNVSGVYPVRYKCTRESNGKKVYYAADCDVEKDCDGNPGLAYGLTKCESSEFGYGKVVQCGGYTYADTCLTECNYEKTEADCTAEGKSFVVKCVDNKNQSWGECS